MINNDTLNEILKRTKELGASDIHIGPSNYINIRVKGSLEKQTDIHDKKLEPCDTDFLYKEILNLLSEEMKLYVTNEITKKMHMGFSIFTDGNRYRVNVAVNNGGYYIVMRTITGTPPLLHNLGFNKRTLEGLEFIGDRHAGLFTVVGSTGSGKSTTLAALIRYIAEKYKKNIITLEDPIEFVHEYEPKNSQIIQKELGRDMMEFNEGLYSALREDPDVILVGEIRDPKTFELALKASETGHLVFGTLHTKDTIATIQRLVAMSDNPELTRERLAGSFLGAIAQKLTVDKQGKRIAIWEMLVTNNGISAQIKSGKDGQIKSLIDNTPYSQSYNKTITEYYQAGRLDKDMAKSLSNDPDQLELDSVQVENNQNTQTVEVTEAKKNKLVL